MGEHPNATVFRKAMEAMSEDPESAAAYLDDDIVWWQIGSEQAIRGKQALLDSMRGFENLDYEVELHDVTASDDHVVGLVNATVRAGDLEIRYRTAEIAHVKDGKITERWAFSDDTQRIADFFSQLQPQ
ncbi:MAG TPA: nuclear transport factor 2 family protein [Acidimicrobiia bacterium]|nr:nuclear transport factor 2 family protein [Acidimicrobiia bacterium]